MKLFYSPGACSMAAHIALLEAGIECQFEKVDLATKKWSGGDYFAINEKGSVPALQLDNGQVVTEAAVVLQYIADQKPNAELAPAPGSMERLRQQEWLNYVATEMHKGFSPLFNKEFSDDTKKIVKQTLNKKFAHLAKTLGDRPYLMGQQFSVADAYLFTILNWTKMFKIDLGQWPALQTYLERISARPAVIKTLKAEGLLPVTVSEAQL